MGFHIQTVKTARLTTEEQRVWLDSGKTKDEWDGKEIYEGDIVKFDNTLMTVEWKVGGFEFIQKAWDERHRISPICEVVGNVYENSELLTQ